MDNDKALLYMVIFMSGLITGMYFQYFFNAIS